MSHVVVFNAALKQVRIATTPTKYLTEVRDEACKKLGMSQDLFTLKYNNKPLSLSQQIRYANLAQGAKLELVQASKSPTVISVALQLPASENNIRLTQKFASNTSLWEILRQFESGGGANYNFTQRGVPQMAGNGGSGAGRLNYEMPVITVMPGHREKSDFVGLQQTLSQLGFDSGSALLKLSFRNSGRPLEEAMMEISQYFAGTEIPAPGAHAADVGQGRSIPDPDKAAPEASEIVAGATTKSEEPDPEPMDVDSSTASAASPLAPAIQSQSENVSPTPPSTTPSAHSLPTNTATPTPTSSTSTLPAGAPPSFGSTASIGHFIQIYAPPTSSTPQAARRPFNESDYIPTIEHAKIHQAALLSKTQNKRLPSDAEIAAAEEERKAKLLAAAEKGASVRVRLPDQTIVQTSVGKEDTAAQLYGFVQGLMDSRFRGELFGLKYFGPQGRPVTIPKDGKRLIQDLRFSSAELVTFVWDEKASAQARFARGILAEEWGRKAEVLKVQEPVVEEEKPKGSGQVLGKAEGKKKSSGGGDGDKESKLRNMLNKGLFKR